MYLEDELDPEDLNLVENEEEYTGCINDDTPEIEYIRIYDDETDSYRVGIKVFSYDENCDLVDHSYDLGSLKTYIEELEEYRSILESIYTEAENEYI